MCLVSDAFPTSKKSLVGWQFVLRWGQIEKAHVDTGRPPYQHWHGLATNIDARGPPRINMRLLGHLNGGLPW